MDDYHNDRQHEQDVYERTRHVESEAERPCFVCGKAGECKHRETELRVALYRAGYLVSQLPPLAVPSTQPAKRQPQRGVVSQVTGFRLSIGREDAFRRRA